MEKNLLVKAIQQAKANVELETTPIDEHFIEEFMNKKTNEKTKDKQLTKKGNTNGN
jgi:hypothetical protein